MPAELAPLRVVSVSIGSAARDKTVEACFDGHRVILERRGTDGDLARARALIAELDGQVAAIGLGGTDRYVYAGGRRYVVTGAERLASAARTTPVVDGSGLKHTLEREAIRRLAASGEATLRGKRVLVVCAVDRFGMAEALAEQTNEIVFGDLMFNLGLPLPLRSLRLLDRLARVILPLFVRLPLAVIYPTGEKQNEIVPKWRRYYDWADVIAGDFLLIRRHLPPPEGLPLAGKTVITNTTTEQDVALLRERGLATLVTTTPVFEGRSFGTNVMEGVLTALAGRALAPEELLQRLAQLGWEPTVTHLQPVPAELESVAS